jgi:tetratricopeptide (TPR) repeat protein
MGAWFESVLVRTEKVDVVRGILIRAANETGCPFYLGPPVRGWVSFFPESSSGETDELVPTIATQLALDIFHLAVHDDDDFVYRFYRAGTLVDEYDSAPDSFEEISDEEKERLQGRPELFRDLLAKANSFDKLEALLRADREKFVFESERLAKFAKLLGLPNASCSYDYLQRAEDAAEVEDFGIEGWDKFIHIEPQPDPTGEKRREMKRAGDSSPEKLAFAYNLVGNEKKSRADLEGALADYQKAIELHPQSAEAYNNRAGIKRKQGRLDEALADYDKAIELNPALAVAYANRGLVRKAKGDVAGALADYNKGIELDPNQVQVYNSRGELKRSQGDWDGAMADCTRAITLQPDFATAYNNRGQVKRATGDFKGALEDYNKAIELQPGLAPAWNNRGLLKHTQGDLDGALADYHRAVQLKPDSPQFHSNRGDALRLKGKLDEAVRAYDQAIALKPDWAEIYNSRAEAKRIKKDLDGALADYDKAIELKPGLAVAYNNRGFVKRAKGGLEGPLADFNKALELKPDFFPAYLNRGRVRALMNDVRGAIADFDKAIELNPKLTAAYNSRAAAKQSMKDWAGAVADYTKAIELSPDLASAYYNRCLIRNSQGEREGALADYNKAVELNPEFAKNAISRQLVKSLKGKAKTKSLAPKTADMKKIPLTENALVLRTDFSDESAWESICAAIQNPENEFTANVDFVSDPQNKDITTANLGAHVSPDYPFSFAFIVDDIAIAQPDHPILVINLPDASNRTFRVIPSQLWSVENNLSIGNMDFEEFADAADEKGVFRGF